MPDPRETPCPSDESTQSVPAVPARRPDESVSTWPQALEPTTDEDVRFAVTSTCTSDGTTIVTVVGDVDLATSPTLRARLLELLLSSPRVMVVQLDGVPLLDSTGLTTLLAVHRRAKLLGVELRLAGPADGPSKVLRITRLDQPFDIYATLAEALRGATWDTESEPPWEPSA